MIYDKSDPAKLGMFSKYGRFSSEKYPIILKKEEILNGERKTLKIRDVDSSTESEEEKREPLQQQTVQQKLVPLKSTRTEREVKKTHSRRTAAKSEKKPAQVMPPPPTRYRPKHIKL